MSRYRIVESPARRYQAQKEVRPAWLWRPSVWQALPNKSEGSHVAFMATVWNSYSFKHRGDAINAIREDGGVHAHLDPDPYEDGPRPWPAP